jgi:hypothetical protein
MTSEEGAGGHAGSPGDKDSLQISLFGEDDDTRP